jgi:hypothetical protein
MMSPHTSLLNKKDFTPLLKPGQIVRVEPLSQFGYFIMPRSAVPEFLPEVQVNLATPFTTSLSAAVETGQATAISAKVTALDVGTLTVAQYRLYAIDPFIQFEVYQPATTARFANKNGPIRFDRGNTSTAVITDNWNLLPEIFVYEDKTPITVKAYNIDMDESKMYAQFGAIGFKYPLAAYNITVSPDGTPEDPIALTIKVAERV